MPWLSHGERDRGVKLRDSDSNVPSHQALLHVTERWRPLESIDPVAMGVMDIPSNETNADTNCSH